jgi:hypothetical protein
LAHYRIIADVHHQGGANEPRSVMPSAFPSNEGFAVVVDLDREVRPMSKKSCLTAAVDGAFSGMMPDPAARQAFGHPHSRGSIE